MEKRDKIVFSLIWKLLERVGVQGIGFLISLMLARLLVPNDYGIIALITVFINLSTVFVQGGFNTALIQKKDADEKDFSSVFYFSLAVAGLLYTALYFGSQVIADFYEQPQLVPVIRVYAIVLFFGAVNSIQVAVLTKEMKFKKLFASSMASVVFSGCIGVYLAFMGAGVWALVVQQIANQICTTIVMWITVKWRPRLYFSFKRVKELLSFGGKILATNLLNTFFLELRSMVIGKIYRTDMLAYFNRGKQFPELIINNINNSIQSVMLIAYAQEQENTEMLKKMVRRSMSLSSYVVFPLMIGLAFVAEPLVRIVLTEKWLPCVPYLQIFCITYMMMPVHTANIQVIKALGCGSTVLKLELIKKGMELLILFVSVHYGVLAIAAGGIISTFLSLVINIYPNRKLISYRLTEQLGDIKEGLLLSLVMGFGVMLVSLLPVSDVWMLLLQTLTGGVIYIGLSYLFHISSFLYLLDMAKGTFRKNR